MRICTVFVLAVLVVSVSMPPSSAVADSLTPRADRDPDGMPSGVIPPYVATYPSAGSVQMRMSSDAEWRGSLELPALSAWDDEPASSSGSVKRYVPVLFSLLIPGTGEIALGYPKRGILLIALEVTAWTGYAYYNDKGLEGRQKFEAFADAHWDYDRWIQNHPAVQTLQPAYRTFAAVDSIGMYYWTGWPGYHSFAAKSDVKLNYYENIGKYDWFISGWEDWDRSSMDTALRDEYRALRRQSNSDLDTADKFIYLSVATRLFSIVETVILARRSSEEESGDKSAKRNLSFTSRSTGFASGEFAFVYRF